MNYSELTPRGVDQYHGSMDQSSSSESQPQAPQESFDREALERASNIEPGPVAAAGRDLMRRIDEGREVGDGPKTEAMGHAQEMRRKEPERSLTRDELIKVSRNVYGMKTPGEILEAARFVSIAARILQQNVEAEKDKKPINRELAEELRKNGIAKQAQAVERLIASMKADGQTVENEESPDRLRNMQAKASEISGLAKAIADYYEKAKISKERDDPFRQIVSFEELMTKFNITIDDDRFRPGGEFALLDVEEFVDDFGREMSNETAHPENFIRWVLERAEFYHDFDPMAAIDLFQGMYMVAGSRKVSMYEILVDFNAYFAQRVPTAGELFVTADDIARAGSKFKTIKFTDEQRTNVYSGEYLDYKDPETNSPTETRVTLTGEYNNRGERVYKVEYKHVNEDGSEDWKPVRAIKENKEEWGTKHNDEYSNAQEEIMYQLWLMTKNHNGDVTYRQDGMPSEVPLKETMAKIYADNIWTRTRRRFLGIVNMPATTKRVKISEDGKTWQWVSEAQQQWNGEFTGQGTVGKAFQRSLAAYYHISEANAAFNGYTIEGSNPFFELLQKGDINGAEIFYKSLITRSLFEDPKYGYVTGKVEREKPETWGKGNVDVEFFQTLNTVRVPMPDGTTRNRLAWERADFVDFVTLSSSEFLAKMKSRSITADSLKEAFATLRKKYALEDDQGNPLSAEAMSSADAQAKQKRLQQLDELEARLGKPSQERKRAFVESLVGKSGIKQSEMEEGEGKAHFMAKFLNADGKNPMEGLDLFAVGLFSKGFASDFTADINPYANIRYSLNARDRMRDAMRDTLSHTEELDDFDAKWAEEWSYTFTFHSGISARNDMGGIGHDAWSKIQNTEFYRLRQTGGGNYPGNLDNLYGIHRLGTNLFEGLKVQIDGQTGYDKTFYEILTGFNKDTGHFDINEPIPQFEFAGNAMRQFYADHMSHAIDLFVDITQKHEFNFDKIVTVDAVGRVIIKHDEMQKLIDSTWKHLRYGFDNNGFLYDNKLYGWWYDEKMSRENGQISRTPHFGIKTLRDLMFSEEVQSLRMYDREDLSGWKPGSESGKMARNVFAYLIKAQFQEHTQRSGRAELYTADQVSLIATALMEYSARVMRGEHGEAISLSGFFTEEEMTRILVMAHAILWQLHAKEYGLEAAGGFLSALLQSFSILMKEIGSGITLK